MEFTRSKRIVVLVQDGEMDYYETIADVEAKDKTIAEILRNIADTLDSITEVNS